MINHALTGAEIPLAVLMVLSGTLAGVAHAAAFPERPVRVVAASAAGGGTDIIARLLAQGLTDRWASR